MRETLSRLRRVGLKVSAFGEAYNPYYVRRTVRVFVYSQYLLISMPVRTEDVSTPPSRCSDAER